MVVIPDLHDAHRQGGPALRVTRLLQQPLVRYHVICPLRVHIKRVPAQPNTSAQARRPAASTRSRERNPRAARLTGAGGGGSGPRARPRKPARSLRVRRSVGGQAPRCTPRGGAPPCPSAVPRRRPPPAASVAPAVAPAVDPPRPWI
jgi:hypothetical protein